MNADTTNWTELREFFGVDITRSFALSWTFENGSLLVDLDLFLKPEHPYYEEPRPSEKGCFRAAFLEFPNCRSARQADGEASDNRDEAISAIAPGAIRGFMRTGEGKYELRGDFGVVAVASDRPLLKIKNLDQ